MNGWEYRCLTCGDVLAVPRLDEAAAAAAAHHRASPACDMAPEGLTWPTGVLTAADLDRRPAPRWMRAVNAVLSRVARP